ncbi:DUF3558 domain-containing protein [Nocardia harenae]|uniref:DUF3558 domain-containing protein n=1 Tax=Nocardia harenae TaxID=358707 RepID=UPI001472414A|nr:DUF3558 domain-containing protein [Nocardia harenae]
MLIAALVAIAVVPACESEPSATPSTSTIAPEALFDPCTLPDDAIRAAGANPERRDDKALGTKRTNWTGCSWGADQYALRVLATTRGIDEFRDNANFGGFGPITIPGRDAYSFHEKVPTPDDNCSIVYPTPRGTIDFYVTYNLSTTVAEEPCTLALRAATALDPYLPR